MIIVREGMRMYIQYLTKSQCCRDVCTHRPRRVEFILFLSSFRGDGKDDYADTHWDTGTLGPLTSINS